MFNQISIMYELDLSCARRYSNVRRPCLQKYAKAVSEPTDQIQNLHDRVVEKVDSLEKTMFFLTSLTGYRFHLARVSGYECYCLGTLLQVFQTYMM